MENKKKILWKLFLTTFYISSFTFGGGFVIVTFMRRKFVEELHWLEESEILDYVAMAQSTPGPIAVNAAILVGWRVAGFWGMVCAMLGTILPPMLILTVVSLFYAAFAANPYIAAILKGMQAGVAAVIADVVCDLAAKVFGQKKPASVVIMAAAFLATWYFKINVVLIILCAALAGIALAAYDRRKEHGA